MNAISDSSSDFHIDELYYMAAGENLDWGFAEGSPLVPFLAKMSQSWLGSSLFALRVFPALSGAATVFIAGLFTRELGGRRFSQLLTASLVAIMPSYLYLQTALTVNTFEPLLWTSLALCVLLTNTKEDARLWALAGIVLGFGVLNKATAMHFAIALFIGTLIVERRNGFAIQWRVTGLAIALLISSPPFIWQLLHGWPIFQHQIESALYEKKGFLPLSFDFSIQQIVLTFPATLIWMLGFYYYMFSTDGRRFRVFAWAYLALFFIFVATRARFYYLLPIYPVMIGGGAVFLERILCNRTRVKRFIIPIVLVCGAIVSPMALPIFPKAVIIGFGNTIYKPPSLSQNPADSEQLIPWHLRIMYGWEDYVSQVGAVFAKIPIHQRKEVVLLAWHYGDAGAIDHYGSSYNLPKAISGHTGYYYWGPRGYSGDRVLSLGGDPNFLKQTFKHVVLIGTIKRLGEPQNIYLCSQILKPLREMWPAFKFYFKIPNNNSLISIVSPVPQKGYTQSH